MQQSRSVLRASMVDSQHHESFGSLRRYLENVEAAFHVAWLFPQAVRCPQFFDAGRLVRHYVAITQEFATTIVIT
ncbi:MAG: hypothetical protein O3B13_16710 [Planctomycetota bacterium]|nr:hypothetical protein [Planctomycetota bacterium]MDA1164735.1 hypothetical protein [Planctomycetota bacterium]